MEININNIIDTYGSSVVLSLRENINDVMKNIGYLNELNFTDVEDIFEKFAIVFLYSPSEFKNKFDNLIKEIGYDYVNIIENDLSILERLL